MMGKNTQVFLLIESLFPCRYTKNQMQDIAKKEKHQQ